MPIWLASALRMLGTGAAGYLGFEAAEGAVSRIVGPETVEGQYRVLGAPRPRRRRRRRALTASDRADIAFIVGLLGTTAGKNFAMTLAGRPR